MVDTISSKARSANMASIRSTGMAPEISVRSMIHKLGYRFRLHRRDLPGKPDMVFPAKQKVIFVHGCFWHQHGSSKCRIARMPKSNLAYWKQKLEGNKARDKTNSSRLRKAGWGVLVIWECQLSNQDTLKNKIMRFLEKR